MKRAHSGIYNAIPIIYTYCSSFPCKTLPFISISFGMLQRIFDTSQCVYNWLHSFSFNAHCIPVHVPLLRRNIRFIYIHIHIYMYIVYIVLYKRPPFFRLSFLFSFIFIRSQCYGFDCMRVHLDRAFVHSGAPAFSCV